MATAASSNLLSWSAPRGRQVAWGPMRLIETALAGLDARLEARELDAAFAEENLAFRTRSEPDLPRDWRLLVVVAPSPAQVVIFQLATGQVDALLPPTYVSYRASFETMRRELGAGPLAGAQVRTLDAPLKSIASGLGLVRYGRNNVTYAERLGSWIQLYGYVTDADLPLDDAWQMQPPALLDECEVCGVCEAACPTGAVSGARVLLHAERCLTLANESPGEWPAWVPTGAHECLAGCLACQRRCPANPPLPVEDSGIRFTEAETAALLADGQPEGPSLVDARRRLERLGLSFNADIIGRNLRALLLARELQTI
jgi:epoxyqueuosine reductase